MKQKTIILTFDVEEFDLLREYSVKLEKDQDFEISKTGLLNLLKLLEKHKLKATFFTTNSFAKKYPKIIQDMQKQGHEIASHGYKHCDDHSCNLPKLINAQQELEQITKTKIKGFRSPRWEGVDPDFLEKSGFKYDSSSHPIYLPGRYFNLFKKRRVHKIGNILEIPLSTLLPNFSIFWLAFKNFPLSYSKIFTKINFLSKDYTMLVFHPWEFTDISQFNIPFYVKRDFKKLIQKLEKYIIFCKKNNYQFQTIENYLQKSFR